jgi:hypothetical protein
MRLKQELSRWVPALPGWCPRPMPATYSGYQDMDVHILVWTSERARLTPCTSQYLSFSLEAWLSRTGSSTCLRASGSASPQRRLCEFSTRSAAHGLRDVGSIEHGAARVARYRAFVGGLWAVVALSIVLSLLAEWQRGHKQARAAR